VDSLIEEPLVRTVPAPTNRTVTANTVPDIKGMPVRRALELLVRMGIVPVLKGQGMKVDRQEPAAGQPWPSGHNKEGAEDVFVLWLS